MLGELLEELQGLSHSLPASDSPALSEEVPLVFLVGFFFFFKVFWFFFFFSHSCLGSFPQPGE